MEVLLDHYAFGKPTHKYVAPAPAAPPEDELMACSAVVTVSPKRAQSALSMSVRMSPPVDLDLHLLLAEEPLELANPLMGFPQGWMSSSRDTCASVFSPFKSCWTTPRLNSTVKTRRPSDFRGNSPMRPSRPAAAG
jgi:hypothetical protein